MKLIIYIRRHENIFQIYPGSDRIQSLGSAVNYPGKKGFINIEGLEKPSRIYF